MSRSNTLPPDKSMSEADWAETPESVGAYVRKLVKKRQRNSRNSSQPPSQDQPNHKQAKPEKPKSARSRGGQTGHAGHERPLLGQNAVDEGIIYPPATCRNCGEMLTGEDVAPYRYQVTDIAVVKAQVSDPQARIIVCRGRCWAVWSAGGEFNRGVDGGNANLLFLTILGTSFSRKKPVN